MKKYLFVSVFACIVVGFWYLYTEIYTKTLGNPVAAPTGESAQTHFVIEPGESVAQIADRLVREGVIRNAWIFKKYISLAGLDTKIHYGEFEVDGPLTVARVAQALTMAGFSEKTITIVPGWDLRDIGNFLETNGIGQREGLYEIAGFPAQTKTSVENFDVLILKYKPANVSLEGYLAPDTYRIYKDATARDIVEKLLRQRNSQFTDKMYADIAATGRTVHEVLTMASLLEREVRHGSDKAKVADLFWRRYDANWGLQADSTVHYVVGKKGNVFTTAEDRATDNLWNTYKYAGLPLGPISNPSLESITAAIYPDKNNYWYFITTQEGDVKFARTLDEHNANVTQYIRN